MNTDQISATVQVIYDQEQDEYILPIPDDMWKKLGWELGDTIVWQNNGDASWTIQKKA